MRIGWRKLYSYLTRKTSGYYSVGVEVDVNGIFVSAFKMIDGHPTWVLYETIPIQEWRSAMKSFVEQHDLENTNCVVAFATKKYQLLQVERPLVQDDELAQALHWSVQELLSSPEEMVVDYFDMPAQTTGGNKVNVVAIKKDDLFDICEGLIEAGLFIKKVTIEELIFCDLVPRSHNATLTLVQKPASEISLNIIKDGKLYFSRSIRGFEQLASFTEMELQMGVIENLSVEVQRSMDFFENQLRQGSVKSIILHLDTEHHELITDLVQKAMLMDVHQFDININKVDELSCSKASCASLGAALMKEYVESESEEVVAGQSVGGLA